MKTTFTLVAATLGLSEGMSRAQRIRLSQGLGYDRCAERQPQACLIASPNASRDKLHCETHQRLCSMSIDFRRGRAGRSVPEVLAGPVGGACPQARFIAPGI